MASNLIQIDKAWTAPFMGLAAHPLLAEFPVALVCMPWGAIDTPSLAMGILKQCLVDNGFKPDLHYLNMLFAQRIGLPLYYAFSSRAFIEAEWFFSYALFGPAGTSEINNAWEDIRATPTARFLTDSILSRKLNKTYEQAVDVCKAIATEQVRSFVDECMAKIDWSRYRVVGFTSTFAQSLSSLLLARAIKSRFPSVKIVFGGANVDSEMGVEFIRSFEWLDYVVHGEAEESFPALLRNIAMGTKEIPVGVSTRNGAHISAGSADGNKVSDLSRSPIPDYSEYIAGLKQAGFHKQIEVKLWFESSRGCWWGAKHHCTFCGLNGSTMEYRRKSAGQVYSEILELSRRYNCLNLCATDNILAMDYFTQLLPKLADANLDINFFYEVKANLTREQVRELATAGINTIQPGIESLSTRLLKLMDKGVTAIQNVQLLKFCREFGIVPGWNLLHGFPGETADDYKGLAQTMLLISHLQPPVGVGKVYFERFSPYYFKRADYGLHLVPTRAYAQIYPAARVDLDKIAYFFEDTANVLSDDVELYLGPAREVLTQWKKGFFASNQVRCTYRRGPGYLIIQDSRPRLLGEGPEKRRLVVKGEFATIYEFCEQIRSFRAISGLFADGHTPRLSDEEIKIRLDTLVRQGIMYQEGDRYLSLAIRGGR